MSPNDFALIAAGVVGAGVAPIHGVLMQRYMIRPIEKSDAGMNLASRRLTPILLQLTTIYWSVGGLALIGAALWLDGGAKLAIAACAAALYIPAAIGNFWGTRGRHPGWALYALSVGLIAYSVFG